MENPTFRGVVRQIEKDVEGGDTLTDALARHPRIFNALFVNLVKAGEASGMLDVILVQLAIYLEKAASLQRKVKGATIYPAIVSGVAAIVVVILMVYVIPVFEKIFQGFGAPAAHAHDDPHCHQSFHSGLLVSVGRRSDRRGLSGDALHQDGKRADAV